MSASSSHQNTHALGEVLSFARHIAEAMWEILGDNVVAVYLHGSAATGDFVINKSDLDLLTIVNTSLTTEEKELLRKWFIEHSPPSYLAGIDCELLTRMVAATPSRLPEWDTIIRVQHHHHQFDVRLVESDGYSLLELAVVRTRGYTLLGPIPTVLIADPPKVWLLQACITELEQWVSYDVIHDRSSAVLTACRAWLYFSTGLLGTKSEAGAWARTQSPDKALLINTALAQRQGQEGSALANQSVKDFCQQTLSLLKKTLTTKHNFS